MAHQQRSLTNTTGGLVAVEGRVRFPVRAEVQAAALALCSSWGSQRNGRLSGQQKAGEGLLQI